MAWFKRQRAAAEANKTGAIAAQVADGIRRIRFDRLLKRCQRRHGWDNDRTCLALARYVAFLALSTQHSGALAPFDDDMDLVWHEHLLDSAGYQADMRPIFGGEFHHLPAESLEDEWVKAAQRRTAECLAALPSYDALSHLPEIPERAVAPELLAVTRLGLALMAHPRAAAALSETS